MLLEPPVRHIELPDLTVARPGIAAGDPNLAVEHIGRVFVTLRPDRIRLYLLPMGAVAGVPDVVPILCLMASLHFKKGNDL